MSILIEGVTPVCLGEYSKKLSVRISNEGIVEKISGDLQKEKGDRIITGDNLYISPGWIDIHTHIYYGVSDLSIPPEMCGPVTGATVLVDAGSSGDANFIGFRDYIIKPSYFPIFAFINIGSMGLVLSGRISENDIREKININNLIHVIKENRQFIKGIKLRASNDLLRGSGTEIVRISKEAAKEGNLPLVVHVGESPPLMEEVVALLDKGDIVTHVYHGKRYGMYRGNNVHLAIKEAYERGVIFDVGHGAESFSFDIAEKAISDGYRPFTIGTDIHIRNVKGPVYNLSTTMSKLYNLGLTFEEVIKGVTINPAEILNIESFRDTVHNKPARFTIFSLEETEREYSDSTGVKRIFGKAIVPKYSIISNRITECRPI
ncbi:MAG: amidohydrolase family protein [Firmicutes bacterium]|nr:amidohydrolase family protein [Bacillota bacterium]